LAVCNHFFPVPPHRTSLRHWKTCAPFRLHSTYTRPPYPGATPSSPTPFNHPRTFSLLAPIREPLHQPTICAHSRCLRSYTTFANKSSGHFFAWSHSLDSTVLHWTRVAGLRPVTLSPPFFAMKLARALAGRPIRALIGVIRLARGKKGPRNPF